METNKTKIVSLSKDLKSTEDRNKILSFSSQKFHSEGFYKTSMDEIASEMQISKKTIYKYFPSKENLLEEICNHTNCEVTEKIDAIVDGKGDVVFKFVRILNMKSNLMVNISDKWLKDISIHAPRIKEEINQRRSSKMNKVLIKLLEQGKKEKLILNFPTPIIINAFVSSLVAAMNYEFLVNNKFTIKNAFKTTYEMLLNGILTENGKANFKNSKKFLAKEII